MKIEFFIPMIPPTVTHQEHRVMVRSGKPVFYETDDLKRTRALFTDHLAKHTPDAPLEGAVRLVTKWIWPSSDGKTRYKITKPDTDNLIKLFKDCMTVARFWIDDAQVSSEVTEKFLSKTPGIYVSVEEIDEC